MTRVDDGITWSAPLALNANAATDLTSQGDYSPKLASDGNGGRVVVWTSGTWKATTVAASARLTG